MYAFEYGPPQVILSWSWYVDSSKCAVLLGHLWLLNVKQAIVYVILFCLWMMVVDNNLVLYH